MRGRLDTAQGCARTVKRALIVLLAYYIVAFGRYAEYIFSGQSSHVFAGVLRFLVLLDVPKAGDFFLSFVLFMLFAALMGPSLKIIFRYPAASLAVAFAAHFAGYFLAGPTVGPNAVSYWKLFFGAPDGARTFPVLPYLPVFVAGLLLGRSYFRTANKPLWIARCLSLGSLLVVLRFLIGAFVFHQGGHMAFDMGPVPSFGYVVSSTGLAMVVFAVCAAFSLRDPARRPSLPGRFLVYVGQNSVWIIVWQYIWIQLGARMFGLGEGGNLQVITFLITMLLVPPGVLYSLQSLDKFFFPNGHWEQAPTRLPEAGPLEKGATR